MLNLRGDILLPSGGGPFRAVCASGNSVVTVTTEPKIRVYQITPSIVCTASATVGNSGVSDITMIAPSTACVVSQSTGAVYLFDTNTLAETTISTNAPTTTLIYHQQVAANQAAQLAISTRSAGNVCLINNAAQTCTTLTIAASSSWSGDLAQCVIFKSDSSTWLVGTDKGKIYEINAGGAVLNTVSLPVTPVISGVTPAIKVKTLSYCPTSSAMLCATDSGQLLSYIWPATTPTYRIVVGNGLPVLSLSSSGTCLLSVGETPVNWNNISELYFENGIVSTDSSFFVETDFAISSVGLNSFNNTAWATTPNTAQAFQLRIFNITPTDKVLVETAAQDPVGVYISGRIIRIRDNGVGTACVEVDTIISAGTNSVSCTDARNYIELCLEGSPTPIKWDIREMQG